jgi:hypothetical protein
MNLDDLKTRLAEQDAKLDQILRLNEMAVRKLQLAKAKSSLRWLIQRIVFELILRGLAVVWLGNFIYEHLREPRFLLPAVLVDVCAIALMASCINQLVLIANLNYSLPVVTLQKELSKLRILRIRSTKWAIIFVFVLWFPVLVVLFEGLLRVDLWLILGAAGDRDGSFLAWVVANVLFGLVVALVIIWVWNRYVDRADSSPAIRHFMDDFAGHSLTKAQSALDSVVQFEREPQGAGEIKSE